MKFKTTKSVKIKLPGEERDYSTREMVRHVVKTGREFGQAREADRLRMATRLLAAFDGDGKESGEVADGDATELKLAIEKPSTGWSSFIVKVEQPVGRNADGSTNTREVERGVSVAPLLLLPLIDEIAAS